MLFTTTTTTTTTQQQQQQLSLARRRRRHHHHPQVSSSSSSSSTHNNVVLCQAYQRAQSSSSSSYGIPKQARTPPPGLKPKAAAVGTVKQRTGTIRVPPTVMPIPTSETNKTKQDDNFDEDANNGAAWTLFVLSLCYVHNSVATFVLPAILPQVSADLHLTDAQAGALTSAQAFAYAIALIPCGALADALDRRVLLALAVGTWSLVTAGSGNELAVNTFATLLLSRALLGMAQGPQNPVAFSLLPELFPNRRALAIAMYNCSVYVGRGMSVLFAAAMVSAGEGMSGTSDAVAGTTSSQALWVPLENLDPESMSLLYIVGDQAAVTPVWQYGTYGALTDLAVTAGWRHTLEIVGLPGVALAALLFLTVRDPSKNGGARTKRGRVGEQSATAPPKKESISFQALRQRAMQCASVKRFQKITLAAALNDIGFWALVAWQATFYERCFPEEHGPHYAAWLVACIVIGGIAGGIGGGVAADTLSKRGQPVRPLLAGVTALSAPMLAMCLLAPSASSSLAFLLPTMALGEAYRAPCAVRVRETSPPGLASTAAAVHLAVRNMSGALGPLMVGALEERAGLDLRVALLCVVPPLFLASGLAFWAGDGHGDDEHNDSNN
ncbi:hypothetical protein PPROV_001121200 [Pycnococcus provasolii]|uniref:Major facilitator superfamily (MFS) profile domain-containing protein n=1 Tax=Pycnococcus provasolii TaxID=41880 RepID=A0A830HZD1_9CHLO|nr:hypothetical protein PPROV_001121200 [Pycnococcus provasolii]